MRNVKNWDFGNLGSLQSPKFKFLAPKTAQNQEFGQVGKGLFHESLYLELILPVEPGASEVDKVNCEAMA